MATQSKKLNRKYHNYSKNNVGLVFNGDNDNYIKSLFYLISTFIKLDDIAILLLDANHEIWKFNDVHQSIFDSDFFSYNNLFLKKSNYSLEDLNHYFETKKYSLVCSFKDQKNIVGFIVFKRILSDFSTQEKELLEKCTTIYSQLCVNNDIYEVENFKHSIYHTMINNIDSHVYVTNPKTYEILFMNDYMKKTYGLDDPVGKICWQVLQNGRKERCDNCPVSRLIKKPNEAYSWEELSTFNDKSYLNYDCMIEWFDHSLVHFQHSVDITGLKKITFDASYDDLTGIYNRKAGKMKLQSQLSKANKNNKDLIVCLYDLNNLKKTNDEFGHIEGDNMLKVITEHVKKIFKKDDVFFRLSGDEFIVSFYNVTLSEVNTLMLQVLANLKVTALNDKLQYELSFCYGLYRVVPESKLSLNEIISNADEKMYEWKKKKHLRNAQLELRKKQPVSEQFDYNERLLYNALSKSTDDYIFICNMKTGVFKYTPNMVKEFNFPDQVIHNAAAIFGSKIHKKDKYEFLNANQQITDGKTDSHIVEYRALNKDNEYVWLRCRGHVEYDENENAEIFAGFITNLGRKNYRDILTGLYNKFEFEKRITESINEEYSVILLNIDDFKSINNLYNRDFGDNILRIFGQNLQTIFASKATVFKLDGDEFAILTKEMNINTIKEYYNEISEYANEKHTFDGKTYMFSITVGVAQAPKDGNSYLEIQRSCEIALQFGKYKHNNKLTFYNQKIYSKRTYQVQLMNTLKQCIHNNFENFFLVYQPIVDIQKHEISKIEALCRWQVPTFVDIGPDMFIPLLEDSGDIIELGYWVFEQAISHLKNCLEAQPLLSVSINVSYTQLLIEDFVENIIKIVEKHKIPYQNIILELTETSIAKNSNLIIQTINQLRELGIMIAMDDFGTGYSSLSLLKDEPLDIIKIDQSFVRGIDKNSFNQTFVKLIIELCHQLNLLVLIEGVETKSELDLLLPFKPDFIQGYYFSKPLLKEEHIKSLNNFKVTL